MKVTKIILAKILRFCQLSSQKCGLFSISEIKPIWLAYVFLSVSWEGGWDICAGLPTLPTRSQISDPIFSFPEPGIRIRIRIKEFQVFLTKITKKTDTKLSKIRSGVFIPDPRSWIWIFFHPPYQQHWTKPLSSLCPSRIYMWPPAVVRIWIWNPVPFWPLVSGSGTRDG
jgi:hypothetical protein